ncbi:hypothetical protein V8C86DRAFT_2906629 [Haematococcus lacustris]
MISHGAGVLMLAKPGPWGRQHCVNTLQSLDAATVPGILFERMVPLFLDLTCTNARINVAGCSRPVVQAGSIMISGMVIRARQLTAPPRTSSQVFSVGQWHEAPVAFAMKGCRPAMKTYTDLRVELEDVTVSAGIGLEPSMAQVVKALKRIVPPDVIAPNGQEVAPSSSSSPALQPWDKLRYIWRGSIRVAARNLGIALAAGPFACPTAHDPHLYLHTQSTAIFWTAGHVDVNATGVTAVGRSHAPDASPGDPLRASSPAWACCCAR